MSDFEKAIRYYASQLTELDLSVVYVLIAVGVALLTVAILVAVTRRRQPEPVIAALEDAIPRGPVAPQLPPPPAPPTLRDRMIAEMTETTKLNGFGGFCVALMLVNWVIAGLTFVGANGAPQQAVALLIWIGGNTFFGLGALLNSERKYRVYKPLQ